MKPTACFVLCAAALYVAPSAVAAQDASRGAALLVDARRALGGEEKLRAIRALDVRGDFKRAAGQMGVKLPHLITRGVNDMTIEEWTIDSYRVNPSFKSDVFTK